MAAAPDPAAAGAAAAAPGPAAAGGAGGAPAPLTAAAAAAAAAAARAALNAAVAAGANAATQAAAAKAAEDAARAAALAAAREAAERARIEFEDLARAAAAGGAGGGAIAVAPPVIQMGSFISRTWKWISDRIGEVCIQGRMGISRLTAEAPRLTLEQINSLIGSDRYTPPAYFADFPVTGELLEAIKVSYISNEAKKDLLSTFLRYLEVYNNVSSNPRDAAAQRKLDIMIEILFQKMLVFAFYEHMKGITRNPLEKKYLSAPKLPVAKAKPQSITARIFGKEKLKTSILSRTTSNTTTSQGKPLDFMPYELADALNSVFEIDAIAEESDRMATKYYLLKGGGARQSALPPKLNPAVDIRVIEAKVREIEENNKIITAEFIDKLAEETAAEGGRTRTALERLTEDARTRLNTTTRTILTEQGTVCEDSSTPSGRGGPGRELRKYNVIKRRPENINLMARSAANAIRRHIEAGGAVQPSRLNILAEAATMSGNAAAAPSSSSAAAAAAPSGGGGGSDMNISGSGSQGGGARRTLRRRLRHQKTRRHAYKHRNHKAKTHHRSRASRRHSRR